MRDWLRESDGIPPRPFVYIEDDINDVNTFCTALASKEAYAGEVLAASTIVILDKAGPGTKRFVINLLKQYPGLQVVAGPFSPPLSGQLMNRLRELDAEGELQAGSRQIDAQVRHLNIFNRFRDLEPRVLGDADAFVDFVDELIRPGGLVLCDINLSHLSFDVPNKAIDRILNGAYAAGLACDRQKIAWHGLPVQRPAILSILSGIANFLLVDRDLQDLGVTLDHNLIYRKPSRLKSEKEVDMAATGVRRLLREQFPWTLRARVGEAEALVSCRVGRADMEVLNATFDVVMWPAVNNTHGLSGLGVLPGRALEVPRPGTKTLQLLLDRYLTPRHPTVALSEIQDFADQYRAQQHRGQRGVNSQSPPQVIGTLRDNFKEEEKARILPGAACGFYGIGKGVLAALVSETDCGGHLGRETAPTGGVSAPTTNAPGAQPDKIEPPRL